MVPITPRCTCQCIFSTSIDKADAAAPAVLMAPPTAPLLPFVPFHLPYCRLNNLYLRWADLKGADCEECQTLSALFARGVDSVKSGEKQRVPGWLLHPPGSEPRDEQGMIGSSSSGVASGAGTAAPSGRTAAGGPHPTTSSANDPKEQRDDGGDEPFRGQEPIWHLLMEQGREASVAFRQGQLRSLLPHGHRIGSKPASSEEAAVRTSRVDSASAEETHHEHALPPPSGNQNKQQQQRRLGFDDMAILGLIHSSDICLSEYALLTLIARWCAMHGKPLVDFARLLDFDRLSYLQVSIGD